MSDEKALKRKIRVTARRIVPQTEKKTMVRLFYKKGISILIVALTVVLVILVCTLLATLVQDRTLKANYTKIEEMVRKAQDEQISTEEMLEYKNSNEYIIQWAIEHGYLPDDVVLYINGLD